MEVRAAQRGDADQHDDLEGAQREHHERGSRARAARAGPARRAARAARRCRGRRSRSARRTSPRAGRAGRPFRPRRTRCSRCAGAGRRARSFSAGAITSANRIGVSSGTAICRGLWAVSAARRRASVAQRASDRGARGAGTARAASASRSGRWWLPLGSVPFGCRGQAACGDARRRSAAGRRRRGSAAGADRAGADSRAGRSRRAPRRPVVPCERDGERRADDEGVSRRDHRARASAASARRNVAVDAQLEQLAARGRRAARPACRARRSRRVDDRHAVAQALGLVEVVGGEQDRHLLARAQRGDHVEQLVADARVEADRRLVEEQDLRAGTPARARSRGGGAGRRCSSRPAGRGARRARASRPARRCGPSRGRRLMPHRRAWSSRFARPVRPRSTTASWKTTLLTLRACSGSAGDVVARQPRACRWSARSSS